MYAMRIICALALSIAVFMPQQASGDWPVNKDAKQTFVYPQDNYEIVMKGDWTPVSTGAGQFISSFANPVLQKSYNPVNNTTTFSFSGTAIAQDLNKYQHFGFGYTPAAAHAQSHKDIVAEYWTNGAIQSKTPAASTRYDWNPDTQVMTVTLANDTADVVQVAYCRYQVFATPIALAEMNRDLYPPAGTWGQSAGVTPVILDPQESVQFTIQNVLRTDSVLVCVDVLFDDPGPGEYEEDVGIWTQSSGRDFSYMIPTVSEWGLVILTLLLLTAGTILFAKRRRPVAA